MSARTRASSPGTQTHYARMIWDLLSQVSASATVRGPDLLYLVPFQISVRMTIDRAACTVWTVAAGNIRMGIYRDNGGLPDGGALLAEGGPQAAVASSKNEVVTPTIQLEPGLYWLALLNDDALCNFVCTERNTGTGGTLTARSVAAAFGALPNPCPVTAEEWYAPVGYVRVASVP